MSVIIDIDLETDLSEFTSTVTDSGDLSWSASAALASTSGGGQATHDLRTDRDDVVLRLEL